MNFKLFIKILILLFVITIGLFGGSEFNSTQAFSDQIIQRGATGDDVIELQSRLQYNGYYHGKIDGVYGWSTYWSVRNFQKAFGLTEVDGLVGQKTKDMLIRATKYNRDFVYANLKKGNRFTHYGGVPWEIQSAPSQQTIEKAKKSAEAKRTEFESQYRAQGTGTPQQIGQDPTGGGQQGGGQASPGGQPQGEGQASPGGQPQGEGQASPGGQPQGEGQANPGTQPQGEGQTQPAPQQEPQQAPQEQQPAEEQSPPEGAQTQEEEQPDEGGGPTAVNMPGGFSENDIQLMSNAVYGEARGEPYIGQVAVAAVILNRLNSATFPNTISGIIFEPLAFTAVADGQIWLTPNEQARRAVLDAINGMDPSDGATYYFNPDTATSKWIWGRPQIKRIGKHIFCR